MITFFISILLYPYPYQYKAFFISVFILLILSATALGIYNLITRKMSVSIKKIFQVFLKIVGVSIIIFFFMETAFSLITIHLVNKQLGFNYATPDTPEGELFVISKIDPGKIMEKTGLTPGDRIQMNAVDNLYRLILDNQGKEVEIPIIRNKKKLGIKIKVPNLDVPLSEISFLY